VSEMRAARRQREVACLQVMLTLHRSLWSQIILAPAAPEVGAPVKDAETDGAISGWFLAQSPEFSIGI